MKTFSPRDIIPEPIYQFIHNKTLKKQKLTRRIVAKDCDIPEQEARYFLRLYRDTTNYKAEKSAEQFNKHKDHIKRLLKKQYRSVEELSNETGILPAMVRDILQELKDEKFNIQTKNNKFELSDVLPVGGKKDVMNYQMWKGDTLRYGFVADTHLCNKHERLDALNTTYDIFADEGIETVFHGGNWIDGEFRFNKYEIHTTGITPQVEYFVNNYPKRDGIVTKIISGDDHEGWFAQRERINIGEYMQMKAEQSGRHDLIDLGYLEADIEMEGITGQSWMRIMHAGGGTAYALSYTAQKIIESLQGGEKPSILMLGHYHKLDYCYPREVHTIQMGCFEDQTIFMRKKKIPAHVGGGIVTLRQASDGTINRVNVEFITFFDKKFYKGNKKYWKD